MPTPEQILTDLELPISGISMVKTLRKAGYVVIRPSAVLAEAFSAQAPEGACEREFRFQRLLELMNK